jgi:cell division protein FtsZ
MAPNERMTGIARDPRCGFDRLKNRHGNKEGKPMMLELVEPKTHAVLKVIGVGGAGGNAVNGMVQGGLGGCEFVAMNSDAQVLEQSLAPTKIRLGVSATQGLGCGGKPEIGRQAAEESVDELRDAVSGADMVFITAGMGGGTGTGASPVVARVAREEGALTVAVVTKPFIFEGRQRQRQAEEGLAALRAEVDTLICIPNQRLLTVTDKLTTLLEAFRRADEVLFHATRGISDLITVPGLINLDFADVKTVMSAKGNALMGTGYVENGSSAEEAARMAISSPLLEDVSISGAEAVLVNICGGENLGIHTVSEAMGVINDAVGGDANVIFGAVIDPEMEDGVRITVIATGFGQDAIAEEIYADRHRMNFRRDAAFDRGSRTGERVLTAEPVTAANPHLLKERWERAQGHDKLEVPAFLRRQMD